MDLIVSVVLLLWCSVGAVYCYSKGKLFLAGMNIGGALLNVVTLTKEMIDLTACI